MPSPSQIPGLLMRRKHREPRGHGSCTPAMISLLLVSGLGLLLAGCASNRPSSDTGPQGESAQSSEAPVTTDGLHLVRETPQSKLWVRPDHHMGRYDDVLVDGIAFAYARSQERLAPDQERRLGEILIEAVNGITADSPVGQANAPGECVVALELALKDLRFHIVDAQGSSVSFVSSFGDATMIVEFRDSTTRTPLLRYAAHRGLGSGPATGRHGADLNRLGRALGEMVTDMMTVLQAEVPSTTERPETVCHDGIYRLTGRG